MSKTSFILAGLSTLGLITVLHTAALAQQPGTGERGRGMDPASMIDRRITNLNRQLNLTADQQKKIRAIFEDAYKTSQPANGQQSRRERLVANRDPQKQQEETDAKIRKVLTAEQVKKYEAMPRGGRGQFGGGMNTQTRIDALDKQLTLTADQKTKLKSILDKNQENMRKLFEQQQGSQDREARRATMQKERDRMNKEFEAVLTPEQVKKYRAAQEQQRQRMNTQGQNTTR
jgi:Spy/CpxP family protein refolding chaperone